MALPIDREPKPRASALDWQHPSIERAVVIPMPHVKKDDDHGFFDVLDSRRSTVGESISDSQLATLLWNSTRFRSSGSGRFGMDWESRSAPSAGGLHPIQILCLPLGTTKFAGIYDVKKHEIFRPQKDITPSCDCNASNVKKLADARKGTTLQLIADQSKIDACYEDSESLLLRDSGALSSVICLVATACNLKSVILGRMGTKYVRMAGIPEPYIGVGAVHISS